MRGVMSFSLSSVLTLSVISTFGQNVVSMTAFPGNQGQYLTLRSPMSNNTYSAFVTSPFSGAHSLISTAIIADRNFARSMYAYRTADRFPSNYQGMARCHRHLKEYDKAISLYHQIAIADPNTGIRWKNGAARLAPISSTPRLKHR